MITMSVKELNFTVHNYTNQLMSVYAEIYLNDISIHYFTENYYFVVII